MATHDYVIDNQSAPAFRSDLNSALQAIVTNNSSATAPATTYANMIWYDTATNILKKRNEANSGWINLGTIDETAGTFTPSGERALASQAQAEAGTDNTTLMTPLRVAQAVDAQVGSSTAGLSVGAVGTYAFMALAALSASAITEGSTIAGSSLRYAGAGASAIVGSALYSVGPASTTIPSGTWRAMGAVPNTNNIYRMTLFLRIS